MALENNKDIEVTRQNVRIAEFDLQAARGVYEPRIFRADFLRTRDRAERQHFQRRTGRRQNDAVRISSATPIYRSFYSAFRHTYFSAKSATIKRLTSDNPISILSPQYVHEV
jgi:outer membrane protein TolC